MVLGISLLIAVLIILVLFFLMRSKFASGNQIHQRLQDLSGNTVKSHAEELERMAEVISDAARYNEYLEFEYEE